MVTTSNISNAQTIDSDSDKVEQLISKLTLDEKISMLHGNSKFTIAGVERLGIPEWKMSDGPHGVREEIERDSWEVAGWDNDLPTDSSSFPGHHKSVGPFPEYVELRPLWYPALLCA